MRWAGSSDQLASQASRKGKTSRSIAFIGPAVASEAIHRGRGVYAELVWRAKRVAKVEDFTQCCSYERSASQRLRCLCGA